MDLIDIINGANAVRLISPRAKIKSVTVRRDFIEQLYKREWMVKTESNNAVDQIYGIPAFITDDPLAPDYVLEYEEN